MKPKKKVEALRRLMEKKGIAACLVPSTDAHQSEYLPACWERRQWLSGFTGSSGDVLITQEAAGLWTDGRYFVQAESELQGSGIELFKMGQDGVPTLNEFLAKTLGKGDVLAVDPKVVSLTRAEVLEKALEPVGAKLEMVERNLIDTIWKDQPKPPRRPIEVLPTRYSGESVTSKLRRVRKEMRTKGCDAHVITALDAIAWLYNIRGSDVDFNPVAIAYALVTKKEAILFINKSKVSADVAEKLAPKVEVQSYNAIVNVLKELGKSAATVWVDGGTTNRWIVDLLEGCELVKDPSPITVMKSKKNSKEIEGMREAHIRDGVAMCRFLRWFEEEVPGGGLTEINAADRLEEFRAEGELYRGLSFRTISGYGEHGALPHYTVDSKSNVPILPEGIYLVDSGAQYTDGTTDITRTVLAGKRASKEQKDRFTRVLKGHIGLARVRFPDGVTGIRLDTLARIHLWDVDLDYNHGTGHGVGAFLNVHEGPRSIGPTRTVGLPLEPGNILSNEPGYYKVGEYGIRIENLILVTDSDEPPEYGKSFFSFETLTMCPIDTRLIDMKLLDPAEKKWLNNYHRTVYRTLSSRLEKADRAWLRKACVRI